jgi:hypothetical protein
VIPVELLHAQLFAPPDISLAEARAQLPGWVIWLIGGLGLGPDSYSALPAGATKAVDECKDFARLDELVKAVREYESHLPEHIAETRQLLADTPDDMFPRQDMLTSRLKALELLEAFKANESPGVAD